MNASPIILRNGEQSITFVPTSNGYRPEWFRSGNKPMLRFKDHEFLNIGDVRVLEGALQSQDSKNATFSGRATFGSALIGWTVKVSVPADGGPGFTVTTNFTPVSEDIEVLEGLTTFETPYEYDGHEHIMTVMAQQPVYRFEGGKEINGAGYMHPLWYYGRVGRAHLTYQSATPLLANEVKNADGGNPRYTMLLGNWNVCTTRDIFSLPTRNLADKFDVPYPDPNASLKPGQRGMKFLMGAVNWNASLHKDPNVLVEAGKGLHQEVTVDFATSPRGGTWDAWLVQGWERLAGIHFPSDGVVPAYEVAKSRGASWTNAAQWLAEQLGKKDGYPGFFNVGTGTTVYAPHTRPTWDQGIPFFCGQFSGPLAMLGLTWNDPAMSAAATRMEEYFTRDKAHGPEPIWTIGPTPGHVSIMRKAAIYGINDETRAKVDAYLRKRADVLLDPKPGARRGDAGILAWEAYANLLASEIYSDKNHHLSVAKECLARVNKKLDAEFWTFNCAAEGDLVGGGQARPFGHAIAATANAIAWKKFEQKEYLVNAQRFANTLIGMHFHTWNESPSPDLDTRGWAHGSTGGRDQMAQIPPWETGHALLQLAYLLEANLGRDAYYDVLWLFAKTGLAQFPKARTMKRLYKPDMTHTYRPIESLATEREFYLKYPYLAYENPWDQTMLAGYQGVEPLQLALFFGGGIAQPENERVLALVPSAATYDKETPKRTTIELWNPLDHAVETRLTITLAQKRNQSYACLGAVKANVSAESPATGVFSVPPRKVVKVELKVV